MIRHCQFPTLVLENWFSIRCLPCLLVNWSRESTPCSGKTARKPGSCRQLVAIHKRSSEIVSGYSRQAGRQCYVLVGTMDRVNDGQISCWQITVPLTAAAAAYLTTKQAVLWTVYGYTLTKLCFVFARHIRQTWYSNCARLAQRSAIYLFLAVSLWITFNTDPVYLQSTSAAANAQQSSTNQ